MPLLLVGLQEVTCTTCCILGRLKNLDYGTPVLMSGLESLVLNSKEVNLIHQHHKNTIRCLQKLPDETPQAVISFMSGTLPATAILHERLLCLFGMVSRLSTAMHAMPSL